MYLYVYSHMYTLGHLWYTLGIVILSHTGGFYAETATTF
jgi:hypothetical protein